MKKCPRCGYNLKKDEKYCPHCGLDLRGKYIPINRKNRISNYLVYIIIIFSMIIVPLIYSQMFSTITSQVTQNTTQLTDLPAMTNRDAYSILATYDTLADFQKQFGNVDNIVQAIENYSDSLSQTGYVFDKEYRIVVYDNYNVSFSLKYTTQINDQITLEIDRNYDRAHTSNTEKIIVQKNGAYTFDELFLTEDEMTTVESFTGEQTVLNRLIDQFKERESEFEQKKETLGHYGIGEYEDQSSFVVYRENDVYYSKMTYTFEPSDYMS